MVTLCPDIWGKTIPNQDGKYYPLIGHMLDTAVVAEQLWLYWLRPELRDLIAAQISGIDPLKLVMFAAGFHDIGKCTPVFQGSLLNARADHSAIRGRLEGQGFTFTEFEEVSLARDAKLHRHEKLGAYSIEASMGLLNEPASSSWLELVTLGHHGDFSITLGSPRRPQKPGLDRALGGDRWNQEREHLIRALELATDFSFLERKSVSLDPTAIILLSGMIVLADRVASNEASVMDAYEKLLAGQLSINQPREWIDSRREFLSKLMKREVGLPPAISKANILGDFTPRGVQKYASNKDGLWIVMCPTGAGKTEAALLRHADKQERLTFLLPTQATTNAMMNRVLNVFKGVDLTTATLGHSLAFLEDFYQKANAAEANEDCGLVPTQFTRVNGAKLAAAVNVATIDQMLRGALPTKWTHLRWLVLANSHIVIDEAHLLDHYQIELLRPLLFFLQKTRTRVTILSATLPTWLEKTFVESYSSQQFEFQSAFPSSVLVEPNTNRGRLLDPPIEVEAYSAKVILSKSTDLVSDHISWAKAKLVQEPNARLGIFVNQVERAQEIALELQRAFSDVDVLCLHSRMLAGHRRKVTEDLLQKCGTRGGHAKRLILVGTQVIEMSLDIDLDFISTDLCPAPSIIQRMGRSWRDKSSTERFTRIDASANRSMEVNILSPFDSKNEFDAKSFLPYGQALGERTHRHLETRPVLSFPDDLQAFVETVYLDPHEATTKQELTEKADEFYRMLKGGNVAIQPRRLYGSNSTFGAAEVETYGALTSSPLVSDELATRLIEIEQEPFVIESGDPSLQNLGALPPGSHVENTQARQAQQATVSLSMKMARLLRDDEQVEKIQLPTYSFGYWGQLPSFLYYDKLVGLRLK